MLSRRSGFPLSLIGLFTGEWLLHFMANGGTAVFWRSTGITLWVYLTGIGLHSLTAPGAQFEFSFDQLVLEVNGSIPWLGAVFAGVYVALYSRFAAQWAYLAGVYNQLIQACVPYGDKASDQNGLSPVEREEKNKTLTVWKAAFIEDALDLHLACKPMFAFVIHDLLTEQHVREVFVDHTSGGVRRLAALERRISAIIDNADVNSNG